MSLFKGKDDQKTTEATHERQEKTAPLVSASINEALDASTDFMFQTIYINGNKEHPVSLFYIDGMADAESISQNIIRPICENTFAHVPDSATVFDWMQHGGVYRAGVNVREDFSEVIGDIIGGGAALVFDGEQKALVFDVKGFATRSISEPSEESVLKGSKDCFVESIRVNTATVRRKLRTPNLRLKDAVVGRQSLTPVNICYIEGLTNQKLVDEVIKRIDQIDVDSAISNASIEEYISDNKFSTFPQIMVTERPDKFCENIVEGRVGIIIDGLPTAYIVPGTLNQFLQAPEDYSNSFAYASMVRLLRYIVLGISFLLPAFFIAVTQFHPEMIPTQLAISIANAELEVPFPMFIQVFLMLFAFEILLEAGLHLPQNIGQAVSIVGSLVVGQAAVEAKIISPAVVIVVAATAIAGFTTPDRDFSNSVRLWRFTLVIFAIFEGLLGLSLGILLLIYSLSKRESFGVPYLSPYVSGELDEVARDTLIRLPMWYHKNRPAALGTGNVRRRK